MSESRLRLETSWKQHLEPEIAEPYMQDLRQFLVARKQAGATVFPKGEQIFAALNMTPFDKVRVVILGQDPYHGPGQAHGLSFSVLPGTPVPPSLRNIYQELATDVGFQVPRHGYLAAWAQQGVLLLNAVLTVEQGQAGAHQGKGWERFTDAVIDHLNREREHIVFLLWGSYAQKKGKIIDRQRHLVLQSPHPSPLSAHRGFFGCRHFSKANQYLIEQGQAPIDWTLPESC